jgi:hypothetical protein
MALSILRAAQDAPGAPPPTAGARRSVFHEIAGSQLGFCRRAGWRMTVSRQCHQRPSSPAPRQTNGVLDGYVISYWNVA